jgi:hypothetical protein
VCVCVCVCVCLKIGVCVCVCFVSIYVMYVVSLLICRNPSLLTFPTQFANPDHRTDCATLQGARTRIHSGALCGRGTHAQQSSHIHTNNSLRAEIRSHTFAHTTAYTHTHTRIHTHIHTHTHTHTRTHTHTHTHT